MLVLCDLSFVLAGHSMFPTVGLGRRVGGDT